MLYKKNEQPVLSEELFKNPTSEYRGTPFWAWNNLLTADELCRQIDIFKQMGLGGFHMHVRTGLKNQYLSDEYMELIKACVQKAKKENMLAWLYDEDRWPSGAAGGLVTKDVKYRARCLLFTNQLDAEAYLDNDAAAVGGRSGKGTLLACYDIKLNKDGYLVSYQKIPVSQKAEGEKWYALLEIHQPSSWYNDQTYADTLNPDAIKRFIEVTHERYKSAVGEEFDGVIPAIFTDEPQFTRKRLLNNSFAAPGTDITMPWTDRVPELYQKTYGADIFDTLPEIFWDLPASAPSLHRYRYHDFIAELFAQSFADTVGGWCKENGIALTGHMMEEPSLNSQTAALGEAMRSYRSFGLPGIDLLCNSHEFTTAKQAQSAAHQFGKEGVLSELYGVTGWDADFRLYKHQGDWQAALGITVRVPHLAWYAMAGEAKRDYPASISYQSPWFQDYSAVENHFARVNTALTRGKPVVRVAVIHPVESFWLHWGPNDKSEIFRADADRRFKELTEWLLTGSIDFDFISESLFPEQCKEVASPLQVGKMTYDTVVVPGCETLRKTTVERLKAFQKAGGRVIFMGNAPTLMDAVQSDEPKKLYDICEKTEYSRGAILTALENDRTLTIRWANGKLANEYLYQLRTDNTCNWLFIAKTQEPNNKDTDGSQDVVITVRGEFIPKIYNTQNGEITEAQYTYQNGNTVIYNRFYGYDSLLLQLNRGKQEANTQSNYEPSFAESNALSQLVDYRLHEDNCLLLDMAEYKIDDEAEFAPTEEILRLDNICREKLGFRQRGGHVVQPWALPEETPTHTVTLRFTVESDIAYEGARLCLEDAADARILFNGKKVDNTVLASYVDISIYQVALPTIQKGCNELIVTLPFGTRTNTENMFIIGQFGVSLMGTRAKITALPQKIGFGSLLSQGFPFYGGAITYIMETQVTNERLFVKASDYRGALIKASVDGKEAGNIIYPPYFVGVNNLSNGKHTVELTLFTHRYNSFGPVHLVNVKESWHGPGAWRSENNNWSYEYVLRATGILKAPVFGE